MANTNDPLVNAISSQLPEVDNETVAAVLNAWHIIKEGPAPGTIVANSEGAVAVRVSDSGVHHWRVTAADGATWTESQPTLEGWTVIKEVVEEASE